MSPARVERPVLIPSRPQTLWRAPAVANFFLGGLGAGLYVAALVAAGFRGSPVLALASWLGPALVAAGFVAVALEAGRPFRGLRVLARAGTSWMSRELVVGGAFMAFAVADLVAPAPTLRALAAMAAIGLAVAQGVLLRHARGVPAWNVAIMPVVFLLSALSSGAGLLLLLEVLAGRTPGPVSLGVTLPLLAVAMVVWLGYLTWSDDAAFLAATTALRQGALSIDIVVLGYVGPFVTGALALALTEYAALLIAVAAALMIAGQARAKWALIRRAGDLRPITLPNLTLRGRPS
ncbi:MAG: polysulfide reductase NrfD [Candidatus Rokubacteria bacterium]|nr:polysulfide reductase NrfD [Candidatus Rokubacteria bacterium]